MRRIYLAWSWATVILSFATAPVLAQPNNDVAFWLDRDTTILLNIGDVPTTYEKIKSLDLFSNPRFTKAIGMLTDERFPIIHPDASEAIMGRLMELDSMVRDIDQLSIAIHNVDENEFRWSVFVRAKPELLENAEATVLDVGRDLLRSSQPTEENDKPDLETENQDTLPTADVLGDFGWGKLMRLNQWLIASNDIAFLKFLPDRVADEKFRSLGKSRKYKLIARRESRLNDRDGLISIYGNPVRMRYLFPYSTQEAWDLAKYDEMPACGINLVLTDSESEGSLKPIVLADAIVRFTQPSVGQAKMYEQLYRPLVIPALAVRPIEFHAFARDETAITEEAAQLYDAVYGENAARNWWANHFAETGLDHFADATGRRNAYYQLRFVDELHSADRPGLILIEGVQDKGAAYRFIDGITRSASKNYAQNFDSFDDGSAVWWKIPEENFVKNSGLDGIDRAKHARTDFMNGRHDAYALTDQWCVQGDMPEVSKQLEMLIGSAGEDHGQPLRELVEGLTRKLGSEQPFMIKYYTEDSWQENLNNIENQHASTNQTFVLKGLNVGEHGNLVLRAGPGTAPLDSTKVQNTTIQLKVLEQQLKDAIEGDSHNSSFTLSIGNSSKIQMFMNKPLLARNEDGHRIDLKERSDLATAIRVMILKSVSESFPRQLFLYSKGENHLRVVMGVYPADSEPNSDSDR